MNDKHTNTYIQEAQELLVVLESSLLELETDPDNLELVGEVFRSLHTIKGGGGMFGFDSITEFVHEIETIYDKIRESELKVTNGIIDLTLKAADQIKLMLKEEDASQKEVVEQLKVSFKIILGSEQAESKKEEKEEVKPGNSETEKVVYRIRFAPNENLFVTGTNPVGLLNELCDLGDAIIIADTTKLPQFDQLDPEKLYVAWDVILSTDKGVNAIKDVFIFIDDDSAIEIKVIDKGALKGDESYYSSILSNEDAKSESSNSESGNDIKQKTVKENLKKPVKENSTSPAELSNIRVSSEKLDLLVNLVGELVTAQARLSQIASRNQDPQLVDLAEDFESLTWELRENALSIRMLPIGTTFSKFKRLVRDLSKDLNKEVELVTDGGETELDKNVIEKLGDPLVHIIRNSIDHGIETPAERIAAGKEEPGRIFLSAEHSGTHVYIKIKDNGKGLNKELIYNKAVERGIIAEGTSLSDSEIYKLIFNAGFSTAASVTNVSGRGVGMDVVNNAISSLRGSVEIESKPGEGTSIILKLPLTLAIIDGLIVRIDKDHFVVPLSYVEECIEFINDENKKTTGRNLIKVRDEIVPFIALREKFNLKENKPAIEQIVVINDGEKKTGLIVDEIIDKNQTVIKSLGKYYKNIEVMSGATVLGDGSVALIIDVPKLINLEIKEEKLNVENHNGKEVENELVL